MSEEIWFFSHLIVPLTDVVIACAFVTKWRKNVLTFDNKNKKVVFYFVLCSLNRTFVPKIGEP